MKVKWGTGLTWNVAGSWCGWWGLRGLHRCVAHPPQRTGAPARPPCLAQSQTPAYVPRSPVCRERINSEVINSIFHNLIHFSLTFHDIIWIFLLWEMDITGPWLSFKGWLLFLMSCSSTGGFANSHSLTHEIPCLPYSPCTHFTLGHSSHTCCCVIWKRPGPSCLVTISCRQLHRLVPEAERITGLLRTICRGMCMSDEIYSSQ